MGIQTSSLMGTRGKSGQTHSRPARSWKAAIACGSAAILAVAFSVPALTTDAQAARCPSGQFWRVSKKICQDKSIGVKLGIFKSKSAKKSRSKASADAPKTEPAPKPVAENAEPAAPSSEKPEPVADARPGPVEDDKLISAGSSSSVLASQTPIIRLKRPVSAAPTVPSSVPSPDPAAVTSNSAASSSPLAAISDATGLDTARLAVRPLETRLVKATYFTATPTGLAAQSAPANTETARRAVLNLLKSRLHTHAERNRDTIIRRATAQ